VQPKSAGLVERVKGALGFGTGPEEGPRGTPAGDGEGCAVCLSYPRPCGVSAINVLRLAARQEPTPPGKSRRRSR
jgi:hypothetical protein